MRKTGISLPRNSALVLLGIWLCLVLYWYLRGLSGLFTLHDYVFQPWLQIRYWTLFVWTPWVPLAPLLVYLSGKARMHSRSGLRSLPVQLGLLFPLSLVHGLLTAMLYHHVGWMDAEMAAYAPWQHMGHFLFEENVFLFDAFIYTAIAACLTPMKPAGEERFARTLVRYGRVLDRRLGGVHDMFSRVLRELHGIKEEKSPQAEPGRLMVRSAGHVYFIRPDEIHWVEAEGDYVSLHTESRRHLVNETMKRMEDRLAPLGFQRIHRSSLVKMDLIRELVLNDSGDYAAVLQDGTVLKLSRKYRDALYEKLTARAEALS